RAPPSAFAGNVNLISPEELVAAGLLDESDLHDAPGFAPDQVDQGKVIAYKRGLLDRAFHHFKARVHGDRELQGDYDRVLAPASAWLDDYALFAALKDDHDGGGWSTWAPGRARRAPAALHAARGD